MTLLAKHGYHNFLKAMLLGIASFASMHLFAADDIAGYWRSIDDKTGFSKGIVHIQKMSDQSYQGTIIKVIPRPNYTPKEFCMDCPAPYTNQRILGLTPLKGLKQDASDPNQYSNGRILDPLSGKIYNCKARLSPDGRRLIMRGYVGISVLGRSQVWIREPNYAE